MSKKKIFNFKVTGIILSITKRIESFFNFIKESRLNKKKYSNFRKNLKDKKILIFSATIIIIALTYILFPTFYDKEKVKDQIKNQILKKYNFKIELDSDPQYGVFPSPHFVIKDVKIQHINKSISKSQNVKFFISIKDNFEFNKIELKYLVFKKTDFKVNKSSFAFFTNLLNNKIADQNIKFEENKLFYLNENDEVIFFSDLKILNYLFQKNLPIEINSKLEIFNLPINLKARHDTIEKKIFTKLYFDTLKLNLENNFIYKKEEVIGNLILEFINKSETIKYTLKNKNFIFSSANNELMGEVNIKPFFLTSNLNLKDVKIKEIFSSESIFINLLKSQILNNKNLNGRIAVSVDNLNNFKHIKKVKFNVQFEEGLIVISNFNFIFKNSTVFNFNDVSLVVENNKIKFIGDVFIDFINIENFYSHFQIKKDYRKNIDRIYSNFIFNLDDEIFEFNELKINGVSKKTLNKYLTKFNSQEKDLFNKITFRSAVREFFKTINLE